MENSYYHWYYLCWSFHLRKIHMRHALGPPLLPYPKDQINWRSEGLLDERSPHSELSKNCGTPPSVLPLPLPFFLPECLILYQFLVILQYLLLIMKNWNGAAIAVGLQNRGRGYKWNWGAEVQEMTDECWQTYLSTVTLIIKS